MMIRSIPYVLAVTIASFCLLFSCNRKEEWETVEYEALHEDAKRLAKNALASMETPEGLEVELFAHESMLTNPTNIAVDSRGRVWLCEANNYRLPYNPQFSERPEGDRILILEDTDRDGKADKSTVFYQGPEINAALGIAVLDDRVIVSHSPNILVFFDEDGDDKADRKETLFTGIKGPDDDHGAHAVIFGPDGRLYFNFGNAGSQLLHPDGSPVLDQEGRPIQNKGKPYWQGMAFRCNPDGTNVEVLGHNFRNIYELTVDPFGTVWQTDNDDDGNKGCRVNYVMEYGNFGYRDEVTGAGWRERRPGMHEEIPKRHWHLNDPGVVPNLLQTGAGSPAGITFYAGDLLPEVFHNQVIHCEALKNVVRSYPVTPNGAGYQARIVNLLKSQDPWFRPSDVAVAPDGSVFVADWYDAGVGGNKMDDIERGRIYRIGPKTDRYKIREAKMQDPKQAVEALVNPNMDVSYQAWQRLQDWGAEAEPALLGLWESDVPEHRARALWLLARLPGKAGQYVEAALADENPDIRITGLRAARQLDRQSLDNYIEKVVEDPSPAVRREAAIALRYQASPQAPALWAKLASQYNGEDRWYLGALGIGADKQPDRFFKAWWTTYGRQPLTAAGKDLIWRMRADTTVDILAELIRDTSVTLKELPRYFRAFHFKEAPGKVAKIAQLVGIDHPRQGQISALALGQIPADYVRQNPAFRRQVRAVLPDIEGTAEWLEALESMELREQLPQLMDLYLTAGEENLKADAGKLLFEFGGRSLVERHIAQLNEKEKQLFYQELGKLQHPELIALLADQLQREGASLPLKIQVVQALGNNWDGQHLLYDWIREGKLTDEKLKNTAAVKLMNCWDPEVRQAAPSFLSSTSLKGGEEMASIPELLTRKGDIAKGKEVYSMYCMTCHQVEGLGTDFGPDLSYIGDKLAKKALYTSILYPSSGINFGYEGFEVQLNDGSLMNGIIVSETEEQIDLKMIGGATQTIERSRIKELKAMDQSLMTANLHAAMTESDLVSLVEYLASLKNDEFQ